MTNNTKAEVFIVESLDFEDEAKRHFEGQVISEILRLGGKSCKYFYIRTKKEFREIIRQFSESRYRYLHLSCHGEEGGKALHTTLDRLDFASLAEIIKPHLSGRRLFLSSCSTTNRNIAKVLMKDSGCISILGPAQDIYFSDAAILWASLYHTMFSADRKLMKHSVLRGKAQEVATMFRVRLNFIRKQDDEDGFSLETLLPQPEEEA